MQYLFERLIDRCLQITYDWKWFNQGYAALIKLIYIPFLKLIASFISDVKIETRHSINNQYFRVFGSDLDVNVIGSIDKLEKWKKTYPLLKKIMPRLGEWEFYTPYEAHVLKILEEHAYHEFWEYLSKIRKLEWIKRGNRDTQKFKTLKALERIHKEVHNLNVNSLQELLKRLTNHSLIVSEKKVNKSFQFNSKYLFLALGNTNNCDFKFQNQNSCETFLNLLPTQYRSAPKSSKLKNLKNYVILRELIITVTSSRYGNTLNQDKEVMIQWVGELKEYLRGLNQEEVFTIKIKKLIDNI